MPRTRAQRRATQGLLALGDDPLRCALTFLSVSDCARGPGETSRALREVVTSKPLQKARTSDSYVLRGEHGVMHAVATNFGTRRWRTRQVAGGETLLASQPFPWAFGESYEMSLAAAGDKLIGSINGEAVLTATDAELACGGIALAIEEGSTATNRVCVEPT